MNFGIPVCSDEILPFVARSGSGSSTSSGRLLLREPRRKHTGSSNARGR